MISVLLFLITLLDVLLPARIHEAHSHLNAQHFFVAGKTKKARKRRVAVYLKKP